MHKIEILFVDGATDEIEADFWTVGDGLIAFRLNLFPEHPVSVYVIPEKPARYMTNEELLEWNERALAGELPLGYAFSIAEEKASRNL